MKPSNTALWTFSTGALLLAVLFIPVFLGVNEIAITCSLYHNANLDEWWPENNWKFLNITLEEFRQFPFPNGLTQLDAVFVNASPDEIEVGDILVFQTLSDPPIIAHRVIGAWTVNWTHNWTDYVAAVPYPRSEILSRRYFSTVGDNWIQQPFEREIRENQVVGKIVPRSDRNIFGRIWNVVNCKANT